MHAQYAPCYKNSLNYYIFRNWLNVFINRIQACFFFQRMTNDFIQPDEIVGVSATVQFIVGIGAIIGPISASLFMNIIRIWEKLIKKLKQQLLL